jgi:hypothetical protein
MLKLGLSQNALQVQSQEMSDMVKVFEDWEAQGE